MCKIEIYLCFLDDWMNNGKSNKNQLLHASTYRCMLFASEKAKVQHTNESKKSQFSVLFDPVQTLANGWHFFPIHPSLNTYTHVNPNSRKIRE